MAATCPFPTTAASYLLGALPPQEREEFSRHAGVCPFCRREIDELTPVVHLLQTLQAAIDAGEGPKIAPVHRKLDGEHQDECQ